MEVIISISSLVVASCALGFTAWQAFSQREFNRISVRPHLFSFTTLDKNNNSARIQVLLINNGLGPAFISSFRVFHQEGELDSDIAIDKALGDLAKNSSRTILGEDYALAEKEQVVLLSVTFLANSEADINEVQRRIDSLDLLIEYSSAFEKMGAFDSRADSAHKM